MSFDVSTVTNGHEVKWDLDQIYVHFLGWFLLVLGVPWLDRLFSDIKYDIEIYLLARNSQLVYLSASKGVVFEFFYRCVLFTTSDHTNPWPSLVWLGQAGI